MPQVRVRTSTWPWAGVGSSTGLQVNWPSFITTPCIRFPPARWRPGSMANGSATSGVCGVIFIAGLNHGIQHVLAGDIEDHARLQKPLELRLKNIRGFTVEHRQVVGVEFLI